MDGGSRQRDRVVPVVSGVALVAVLVWAAAAPGLFGIRAAAQAKSAADLFKDKCAVCHGDDGAGKTARGRRLKVKDVRETVGKVTADQMADIVTKGKDPDMDAFGKEFTPDQVKQIVAYYRDLAQKK